MVPRGWGCDSSRLSSVPPAGALPALVPHSLATATLLQPTAPCLLGHKTLGLSVRHSL